MDWKDSLYNYVVSLNLEMFSFDEFVMLFCVYNFFKLLSISSLMELLWPTQFFNRKNTILFKFVRRRSMLEFVIYLHRPFKRQIISNRFFIKYIFLKK